MEAKSENMNREVVTPSAQNIWLCQMGRKAEDGKFPEFADKVSAAGVAFSGMDVEFQSPSLGVVRFGWEGGFSVDGVEIQLRDYPRYDNPYSKTEFNSDEVKIAAEENELTLNWKTEERSNI
jgi:hypothetical protein